MQSGELVRYAGRPAARVGGRDYPGPRATDRFYAVADGHIRVFSTDRDAVVRAGLLSDPTAPEPVAVAEIQGHLSALRREEAVERLVAAGVVAVPARHFGELPGDDAVAAGRYLATQESVDGRTYYLPGRFARFSRTEREDTLRTPGIGEHSRELLQEAGLSPEAIDAAIASGVVVDGDPVLWYSDAAGRY